MQTTRIVVMGVSGAGKSTVGSSLAVELRLPFLEGDDLHPPVNIAKMAAGVPLDAGDREPWLRRVGQQLSLARSGLVVTCSALQRSYRDLIRQYAPDAVFIHLAGDPGLIAQRLAQRTQHFMPASLLPSQLALLEPLADDEAGLTLPAELPVHELTRRVAEFVRRS